MGFCVTVVARSDATLNLIRRSRIVAESLSRIPAAANIRVAHAHVNNLVSRMARVYAIGTRTHTAKRISAILRHGGRSSCEIENEETDWKCHVGTAL